MRRTKLTTATVRRSKEGSSAVIRSIERSAAMSIDIILTTSGVAAALVIGILAAIQPTMIRAEDGAQ